MQRAIDQINPQTLPDVLLPDILHMYKANLLLYEFTQDESQAMNWRYILFISATAIAFPGWLVAEAASTRSESIKEVADTIGLRIGVAVSGKMMRDPISSERIRHHAHFLVPEYGLKEDWIHSNGDKEAKDIQAIARSHNLDFYGHTLHFQGKTPEIAGKRLQFFSLKKKKAHYSKRFKKIIQDFPYADSWEVTNEDHRNYNDHTTPDNTFKERNLKSTETLEFLAHSIDTARKLTNGKILVLNENNLYCHWKLCENKRRDVLNTLRELKKRNKLPDAIGLQSHLTSQARKNAASKYEIDITSIDETPFEGVVSFIDTVTGPEFDLKIRITELDFDNSRFSGSQETVDRIHAAFLLAYLNAVLRNPNVTHLTFWGLHDHADHWRLEKNCGEPYDKKIIMEVELKACSRPTLFDVNWTPKKPVVDAVLQAIRQAPNRSMD